MWIPSVSKNVRGILSPGWISPSSVMQEFVESVVATHPRLNHVSVHTEWTFKPVNKPVTYGVAMWDLEYAVSGEFTSENEPSADDVIHISCLPANGTFMRLTMGQNYIHSRCPDRAGSAATGVLPRRG
jgi:hypothetical protein